jgi:hypothetical protein
MFLASKFHIRMYIYSHTYYTHHLGTHEIIAGTYIMVWSHTNENTCTRSYKIFGSIPLGIFLTWKVNLSYYYFFLLQGCSYIILEYMNYDLFS